MSNKQKILDLAEKYKNYTAKNLSKLIQKKSLSRDESEAAFELKRQMEEAKFDEVFIDGIGNVIGRIGNGKKIIAIDGHIDTVDVGNMETWEFKPLAGEIKDGFVHGRGSVDQKGGTAAFVTAGRILKDLVMKNDVTVYFVGSIMEEDCDGLCWKYIIEEDTIKPDCVVITEPTNMKIYRGHRGRMEIEVEFTGVSAHGSAPERGKNAIYMASESALRVEKLNEELFVDQFLGKGSITVTDMKSSTPSLCAVPDYCKLHLDRRLTWGEDKKFAVTQIRELIKGINAEVKVLQYREKSHKGIEYGMEKYYPTWMLKEDHPIIQKGIETYTNLFNEKPIIDKWTFSTNAVVINGIYEIPVVGFGPGDETLAHAPNEKVPIEHLVKASAFYVHFCEYF